jgi:sporulation protein YlmC with PRC-barrel domain
MLRSLEGLLGFAVHATDGKIGKVEDFYFDDHTWRIRYMIVDTGNWLTGRQVLISPVALRLPDWSGHQFPVSLTKQQVEDSPTIFSDLPVSRQHENELDQYYGWPSYWGGGMFPGEMLTFYPQIAQMMRHPEKEPASEKSPTDGGDPHLRSVRAVTGYHVQAIDGEIGHIEDFIVDDRTWGIRYLVVDTRNWLPGKRVLVSPRWIGDVVWREARVRAHLAQHEVKDAPEYHRGMVIDSQYEEMVLAHHRRARRRPAVRAGRGSS